MSRTLDNWASEDLSRTWAATYDDSQDGMKITVDLYVDGTLAASASGTLDEGTDRIATMAVQQFKAAQKAVTEYRKAKAQPVAVVDPCEEGEG